MAAGSIYQLMCVVALVFSLIIPVTSMVNLAVDSNVTCIGGTNCSVLTDDDLETCWPWNSGSRSNLYQWAFVDLGSMVQISRLEIPDKPSNYEEIEFTFSDGRNVKMTADTSRLDFTPVLTRSLLLTVTDFVGTKNSACLPDIQIWGSKLSANARLTSLPMASCHYAGQACPDLIDGDYDTYDIVRVDQTVTLSWGEVKTLDCVSLLEAVTEGLSAEYNDVDVEISQEATTTTHSLALCPRPMTSGVTWQHVCFSPPINAQSLSITPRSLHSTGAIVNGFRDIEAYSTGLVQPASSAVATSQPEEGCQPGVSGARRLPPVSLLTPEIGSEVMEGTSTARGEGFVETATSRRDVVEDSATLRRPAVQPTPELVREMLRTTTSIDLGQKEKSAESCNEAHLKSTVIVVSTVACLLLLVCLVLLLIIFRHRLGRTPAEKSDEVSKRYETTGNVGRRFDSADDAPNGYEDMRRHSNNSYDDCFSKPENGNTYEYIKDVQGSTFVNGKHFDPEKIGGEHVMTKEEVENASNMSI